ncbi:MAG TPA: FAD-dependent oxidoreductase [Clostridiales bacterium]|jgi:thioredoxin reductase (NADPH)|nr:FAD-dependent oxidoreductase [Clostridiales bacterium]
MAETIYDLIIIGGGSAGLAAGIYAGRAKLKTLILDKANPGGQIANTADVVNYPAIRRISGPNLVKEMHKHALDFKVHFGTAHIERVELDGELKRLYAPEGTFVARSVIIATGAEPRRIGFPGEREFTGRGIAYCATCDGEFFSGLDIFVIGGGYAAAEEAVYLTRFGTSVTIVVREPDFTCAKTVADQARNHPKIKVLYNTEVVKVEGDDLMRKAVLRNNETGETITYEAGEKGTFGMFVFAGYEPATKMFQGLVDMDPQGYILTDDAMRTNIPGVFAAGDLRPKILRQIVTAVADGAIAATSAERYVAQEKERLGIPMHEEEETEAPAPAPAAEAATPAAEASNATPAQDGQFINAVMREQLSTIFGKLKKDLTLLTVVDPTNAKSAELLAFLKEVEPLSPRIHLQVLQKGQDPAAEEKIYLERFPSVALLDDTGAYTGVTFSGIPGGHEMNSFVLALYHYGADDKLTPEQIAKIQSIKKPLHLAVCVSLTCHLCPEVVSAAQSIALKNPLVRAEMIDLGLFPEIRQRHKVMSVPVMLINNGEKIVFGAKSMDQILDILTAM